MRVATPLIVLAVVVGVVRARRRRRPGVPAPAPAPVPVLVPVRLRFRMPNGHDPAAALAALRVAGFTADPASAEGHSELVITCLSSEREQVREVLHDAPSSMSGNALDAAAVTFQDEAGPREG